MLEHVALGMGGTRVKASFRYLLELKSQDKAGMEKPDQQQKALASDSWLQQVIQTRRWSALSQGQAECEKSTRVPAILVIHTTRLVSRQRPPRRF